MLECGGLQVGFPTHSPQSPDKPRNRRNFVDDF